jgi:hypothetical protein
MGAYYDIKMYHLTPQGWVTGERPSGAVETWQRWASGHAGRRTAHIGWTSLWADPRIPRSERDALRAHHRESMGMPGRVDEVTTTIGDPI